MLVKILTLLPKPLKRIIKKKFTKFVYFPILHEDWFNRRFMNLGYVGNNPPLLQKEELNEQLYINLYQSLFKEVEIKNKTVLEVGCGKGGGCYYAYKYLNAKLVVGIDLVKSNIDQCKKLHENPSIHFRVMDAEKFTFQKKFDVIINLESSHCYYERNLFVERVKEVLKPDGHFIYADIMRTEDFLEMESYFKESGFNIIKKQDISQNVLKAIPLMDVHKKKMKRPPFIMKRLYKNLAVTGDSDTFSKLKKGELVYLKYVLINPKI